MIKKNNKTVGFIHKNNQNIDKVYKGTELIFEQGYTREQTGVPPIITSYQAIGKNLKDYKIYGNSVQDGTPSNPVEIESVGDLITDTNDVNYGKYKIPVIVGGNNKFNINTTSNVHQYNAKKFGKLGKTYTVSLTDKDTSVDISGFYLAVTDGSAYAGHFNNFTYLISDGSIKLNNITTLTNKDQYYLAVYPSTQEVWDKIATRFNIMIVEGDRAKEYESYIQPITTNIYLDEPLRKIGDYSDYIDFRNQKEFRNVIVNDVTGTQTIENSYTGTTDSSGTSISLPNIPTIKGTTIFEIDTEIQPSSMYIKYKSK